MIFISFFLDGILSTTINFFVPLLTLTSIVISTYYKNKDTVLRESVIVGILYDVVYTDTIILNSIIFFLLVLLVFCLKHRFRNNLFNIILTNIFIIILYLLITYIIYNIYKYINIDLNYLLKILINSSLFNSLYIIILYIFVHKKIKNSYN